MRLTLIVGERPIAALRPGRDVSAARPSRSEFPAPYPSRLSLQEGAGDERGPAADGSRRRTHERADGLLVMQAYALLARGAFVACASGEAPGDDRTRCACCGRRREAVVARPRWALVGLAPPAGTHGAPRRPIIADGALIPAGVDLHEDGAPEHIEFSGAGAPCAPQFRFDALDGLVGSDVGDKFGDRAAAGALQQAFFLSRGEQVAIDFGHGGYALAFG